LKESCTNSRDRKKERKKERNRLNDAGCCRARTVKHDDEAEMNGGSRVRNALIVHSRYQLFPGCGLRSWARTA
jgi:hypothetical protein